MGFFFYLGISLIIWLCVGCIAGLKILYVDGGHRDYQESLDRVIERRKQENDDVGLAIAEKLQKSKLSWIAMCSLLGFCTLYWNWTNTGK